MRRIISLNSLSKALGSPAQKVLYMAQEGECLAMQPGDANIFIDIDLFMVHLENTISEEVLTINQNREKWRKKHENNRY